MILVPSKRALVFGVEETPRILAAIPTAIPVHREGKIISVVPHRLDETRVLRNIGFDAPNPVRHYYSWPGRFTPFAHQVETTAFLTENRRAFCLNDMGTGKTLSILWAFDYLKSIGHVHKMVLFSPLSTLERVWGDEIFLNFPHLNYQICHSYSAERRKKLLNEDADIYIINHDGVKILADMLRERTDIDVACIDESAAFRNYKTDRWAAMEKVVRNRKYLWLATGSPTPNRPTDAWAQCKLVVPERVPKYFTRFRDMTMKQRGPFTWVERPEALEIVAAAMQPSKRFKREDCLDLPPITVSARHVELSSEQQKLYKEMVAKLRTEYEGGTIAAVNEAVKAMKLVQIACGVAYAVDGEHIQIPVGPRVQVVKEIIEEAEGKVLVFVPLTGGLEMIAEEIRKDFSCEVVYGEVGKTVRDDIFMRFQKLKDPHVIVAHPKCMAHGLNLQVANTIIWYIPTWDNEVYEQACDRIPRPGQKLNMHIIHIEGTEVERRMYRRLAHKGERQDTLLDMLEGE